MSFRWAQMLPLLWAGMIGVLIALLNWATELPPEPASVSAQTPDLLLREVQSWRFDARGDLASVLIARTAKHLPQDDTMLFEQPRLTQNRPGSSQLNVSGEQAKTIHRAADVWFYGAVEMHRAADARQPELVIRTRDMHVNTDTQVARSSAPVTAEMGAHRLRAVGFVADHRNETLQLLSQVSMTYVPNKASSATRSRLLP